MPALLALVFGWFAFRSRVTGVYLSIITQALSYALMLAFFRNDMGFGGNNGFTDFKEILGFDLQPTARASCCSWSPRWRSPRAICACRAIVASRAGRVMRAIRDAESRTRFLGYPRRVVQAVGVRVLGRHRRHRRRAVRAAGRHHQPERVRADQLDRSGHLGGGRRPRHAVSARRPARCW